MSQPPNAGKRVSERTSATYGQRCLGLRAAKQDGTNTIMPLVNKKGGESPAQRFRCCALSFSPPESLRSDFRDTAGMRHRNTERTPRKFTRRLFLFFFVSNTRLSLLFIPYSCAFNIVGSELHRGRYRTRVCLCFQSFDNCALNLFHFLWAYTYLFETCLLYTVYVLNFRTNPYSSIMLKMIFFTVIYSFNPVYSDK